MRGGAVRALLKTFVPSPYASKVRRKPEALPLRGLGPPRTERVRGGGIGRKIRARTTTVIYIRFGRTRACITPISLHREKILLIGSFRFLGKRIAASNRASSRIIHLSCYMFALLFSLGYYVVVTHVRGHISGPSSPSQLRAMVGGIPLKSIFYFVFFNYKSLNGVLLANMRGIHRQPAHRSKGNHRCSQRGTMTRTEWPQLFR